MNISATLPTVQGLTRLTELNLGNSRVSGTLMDINSLSDMNYLNIHEVQLSGTMSLALVHLHSTPKLTDFIARSTFVHLTKCLEKWCRRYARASNFKVDPDYQGRWIHA